MSVYFSNALEDYLSNMGIKSFSESQCVDKYWRKDKL